MASTKKIIAEQILRRLSAGNPSVASKVHPEEIYKAVEQVLNGLLRTQHLEILQLDETVPAGSMLAFYENVPVTPYRGVSKCTLPAIPVSLIKGMGVFSIRPYADQNNSTENSNSSSGGSSIPAPTGPYFSVTISGGGYFSFVTDKYVTADWGDGTVEAVSLPSSGYARGEHYYGDGEHTLKVYHNNAPKLLSFSSNYVYMTYVDGSLPSGLTSFTLVGRQSGGISNLPVFPSTVNYIDIRFNSLSIELIDGLIDTLVSNGKYDGTLQTTYQTPRAIPTNDAGLATLGVRGWQYNVDNQSTI